MRAAIIINPRSGAHRRRVTAHGSRQDHARRSADLAGVGLEIRVTTKRNHAAELAAELLAAGMDRIIVWGGDGTVNEAAGPLIGSQAALGIVRGGSGDGLAGSLGVPRDPDAAIRLALTAKPRPIDVGWLGGRHFLNVAGIGFDAEVGRRFNLRARRGVGGYIDESIRAVWRYRCVSYRLDVDGQRLEGPRFVIVFANGKQYGNGISIAPDADLSDGLINMVLVSGGGPFRQLWRARRLGIRPMDPAEGIWRQQLASAEISGTELVCHVDGETFEAEGTVELRVTPGGLNVIAGAG
jgi:diacylglycerol kinase (ATP)